MIDTIVLAAGRGLRTNLNVPKQLSRLGGKPIIIHSLEVFQAMHEVGNIVVACIPDMVHEFDKLTRSYGIHKATCIPGGETRQESTCLALKYCTTDRVIVHEAARPFITTDFVRRLLNVDDSYAVVPCIPIVPTVADVSGHYLDRSRLVNIQLPQVFNRAVLVLAHGGATGKNYTDDSSLVFAELGIFPTLVNGLEENIKITTPLDVLIAKVIYNEYRSSDRSK